MVFAERSRSGLGESGPARIIAAVKPDAREVQGEPPSIGGSHAADAVKPLAFGANMLSLIIEDHGIS